MVRVAAAMVEEKAVEGLAAGSVAVVRAVVGMAAAKVVARAVGKVVATAVVTEEGLVAETAVGTVAGREAEMEGAAKEVARGGAVTVAERAAGARAAAARAAAARAPEPRRPRKTTKPRRL